MKTSFDIRNQFLEFFASRGHTRIESSPLVPHNDPTLLFTNAGMVQFKGVFLGEEQRSYSRATSSQKCMRAGGKHNDLENVGRTARHHTFFEMLGNFSFGDYFKAEAIALAWEFITSQLAIAPDHLWVTVFHEDDDACSIWENRIGVAPERIVRLGEKDNFWSMGDTGPCGPCSEILIDQGESFSCGRPDCRVGCDCDRYLELWNLVFMQFNRDANGVQTPLPKPSIDTGMGLERITAVVQNVGSNYDTDLFKPLIACAEKFSGKTYGTNTADDVSLRIIADHSRAISFLVADGVLPSNEGRGYVLRRIMRRAARHGRLVGISGSFLHEAVRAVARQMQPVYPDLEESIDFITRVVVNEEQAFSATLESGLTILEDEINAVKSRGLSAIPGDAAFKLYDTYGFPLDLTADIAAEHGLQVDQQGFEKAMSAQRARARQSWKGSGDDAVAHVYKQMAQEPIRVTFNGYKHQETSSTIKRLIKNGLQCDSAQQGDEIEIISSQTPFYAEAGGQVGDRGKITGENFEVEILDTTKPLPELVVHRGIVRAGRIAVGDHARFSVDSLRRRATAANHTATHILHAVLRAHLGSHVKQAGSLVTAERLRFDFTHFEALTREDLQQIEERVNDYICRNESVSLQELSRQEAMSRGATALFGEKYGEQVRVVSIADYSMELCGGIHTGSTGEIGLFKIISAGAVAAGVRRIEAVTGLQALHHVQANEELLARLYDVFKTEPGALVDKARQVLATRKGLEKEIERLKGQLATRQAESILDNIREISGVRVLATSVAGKAPKELRTYGDQLRDRIGSGIIVFGAESEGKAHLLVMVTRDLAARFSARGIIQQIAPLVGGRGGGKNDLAQAGGKEPQKIDQALKKAVSVIEQMGTHNG